MISRKQDKFTLQNNKCAAEVECFYVTFINKFSAIQQHEEYLYRLNKVWRKKEEMGMESFCE
jgi:hypothetical protein